LNEFDEVEALEFVKKALNIKDNLQNEEVEKLTKELQLFPLALGQEVTYINENNIVHIRRDKGRVRVSDYLKKYVKEAEELFDFKSKYKSDRYTKTTFMTWKITIETIMKKECGLEALNILEIMAYLAPDEVYIEEIFSKLIADNKEKLWNAVELIDRYLMINVEKGVSNIHRLVQKIIRLRLKNKDKEEGVSKKAVELINNGIVSEENTSYVTSDWNYASEHGKLIDDSYFNSNSICIYSYNRATLLHLLAESGNDKALKIIVEHIKAKHSSKKFSEIINVKDKYNMPPLHYIAMSENLDVVQDLVEQNFDVNAKNKYDRTPLHFAAYNGQLDVVQYLVEQKAYVNAKDEYDRTLLHFVAESRKLDVVQYLL
jgi:hypothetical protein